MMLTGHSHPGESGAIAPAASAGSLMLDIGPGRGALIIYPDERYRGREIEISASGAEHRVHTGVHDREAGSGLVLSAVSGSLAAGDYVVWRDADTGGPTVTVPEAGIAEVSLS